VKLQFLKVEKSRLILNTSPLETTNDIPSTAIRKFHSQLLELANKSLNKDPVHKRHFGAITVAIDPDKVGEAKKAMSEFMDKMETLFSSGKKKRVYSLSMQLFPLDKESQSVDKDRLH